MQRSHVAAVVLTLLVLGCAASAAAQKKTPQGDSTKKGAADACGGGQPGREQFLLPGDIPGKWVDDNTGATVVITPKNPNTPTSLLFKGRHEWEGSLAGNKLVFKRTPKPEEMSEGAPEWARKAVAGKLEWSLELEAKAKCAERVLEGKWFPGELKFVEEVDSSGSVIKREASVIGKGKPIDVRWRAPLVSIQLLAQTVAGPVKVLRLFQGVPTVIEAVFGTPQSNSTTDVTVTVDGKNLTLTANRDPQDYRRFVTDVIVPGAPKASGTPP